MKTFSHLWEYLADFFLQWELCQAKAAEKMKTRILRSLNSFPKIMLFVRMSKNVVEPEKLQMIIRRRIKCWISNATRAQTHFCARAPTHTRARAHTQQYIILIAFPQQQWLRERDSMLRYTCITWLVKCYCSKCLISLLLYMKRLRCLAWQAFSSKWPWSCYTSVFLQN